MGRNLLDHKQEEFQKRLQSILLQEMTEHFAEKCHVSLSDDVLEIIPISRDEVMMQLLVLQRGDLLVFPQNPTFLLTPFTDALRVAILTDVYKIKEFLKDYP